MNKSLSEMAEEDFSFQPMKPQFGYTSEHAAQAVYGQLWELLRKVSNENVLDRDEVLHAVWRKLSLDSLRARKRPNDFLHDLEAVLTEWKKANG